MSTDASAQLDEAQACHDDDPVRGAALLRQIDPVQLPVQRFPGFAALLNHVLGEKLSQWPEALAAQQRLLELAQPEPALVLWRQLGAAALAADAAGPLARSIDALAQSSSAAPDRARELVDIAAAMYLVPSQAAEDAAQTALRALGPLSQGTWPTGTALDAQAAVCTNNLASALMDRCDADLRIAGLRAALSVSAELAHRLWLTAGTWMHQERALYGRALACTTLGEPHLARRHAMDGLAVLDAQDDPHCEDVDRAFLELERWNACVWLGLTDEAEGALTRAQALAAAFNDEGLTQWFEGRRKRLPGYRR